MDRASLRTVRSGAQQRVVEDHIGAIEPARQADHKGVGPSLACILDDVGARAQPVLVPHEGQAADKLRLDAVSVPRPGHGDQQRLAEALQRVDDLEAAVSGHLPVAQRESARLRLDDAEDLLLADVLDGLDAEDRVLSLPEDEGAQRSGARAVVRGFSVGPLG